MLVQEMPLGERFGAGAADAVRRATTFVEVLSDPMVWLAVGSTLLKILLILVLTTAFIVVVRRVLRRMERRVRDLPNIDPRRQRVMTVSNLIDSVATYVLWAFAGIMVLSEAGFNIGPLLAGAGIAGLAIGFGAQTFVRDVISGLFLLFDDIVHIGDRITFGEHAGIVEGISLRLIKVRKFDGELLMVPAGELRTFGNGSVGFARVVVPVGVSYEQDTDTVLEALRRVALEWATREENRTILLEDEPQVQALMSLGDSAVVARIVVQVVPGEQFRGERDLRLLIKQRFDEWGIEIPFPRRTLYVRDESSPPPRHVELPPLPDPEPEDPTEGAD
jgi:moderate conductance mechanosensitive channel